MDVSENGGIPMKWQFDVENDHLTYCHMGLLWFIMGLSCFQTATISYVLLPAFLDPL